MTGRVGPPIDESGLHEAAPAEAGTRLADGFRLLLEAKTLLDARQIDDVARQRHGG